MKVSEYILGLPQGVLCLKKKEKKQQKKYFHKCLLKNHLTQILEFW